MSGIDEVNNPRETISMRERIRPPREFLSWEEEREQERKRRTRRRRIKMCKRISTKIISITGLIILTFVVINVLISPAMGTISTTEVCGNGTFDRINIQYEISGSYNKYTLTDIIASDENFTVNIYDSSFYTKNLIFYVTVCVDGYTYPTESFIVVPENETNIICRNNITIRFVFDVVQEVEIDFWQTNVFVPAIGISILLLFLVCIAAVWCYVNDRWGFDYWTDY